MLLTGTQKTTEQTNADYISTCFSFRVRHSFVFTYVPFGNTYQAQQCHDLLNTDTHLALWTWGKLPHHWQQTDQRQAHAAP